MCDVLFVCIYQQLTGRSEPFHSRATERAVFRAFDQQILE